MTEETQLQQDARKALRNYVAAIGGMDAFIAAHDITQRTAQRLYQGKSRIPPGIAREIGRTITGWPDATQHQQADAMLLLNYAAVGGRAHG